MKHKSKVSVFGAVLALGTALASADTIQIGSYQTGGSNLGNGNTAVAFDGSPTTTTFMLNPNGAWTPPGANSVWVSNNPNSGPGGSVVEPTGTYSYTTTFMTMSGAGYTGTIFVLADDSTSVIFNGITLVSADTTGPFPYCAVTQPNCVTPLMVDLPPADFVSGLNTLQFNVYQDTAETGLDFYGSVSDPAAIPEPATLMLLGTGLIGSVSILRRKMAKTLNK